MNGLHYHYFYKHVCDNNKKEEKRKEKEYV